MALVSCNIDDNILIWKIEESEEILISYLKEYAWIHDFLSYISHPEKRIEYLASRVLVKHLCEKNNTKFDGIFKDEHHKPYLVGQNAHISISHSSKYCVAIFNKNQSVGIDIQAKEEKLTQVASKFLSTQEISFFNFDLNMLCRAWCAKEATYKMIGKKGVSLKNQIKIVDIDINTACLESYFENQKYSCKVIFYTFDNYVVGFTA